MDKVLIYRGYVMLFMELEINFESVVLTETDFLVGYIVIGIYWLGLVLTFV